MLLALSRVISVNIIQHVLSFLVAQFSQRQNVNEQHKTPEETTETRESLCDKLYLQGVQTSFYHDSQAQLG